jgi:hypothetical protein
MRIKLTILKKKLWLMIVFGAVCGCFITLITYAVIDYYKEQRENKLYFENQLIENTRGIEILNSKIKEDERFKQQIFDAINQLRNDFTEGNNHIVRILKQNK